MIKQKRGKGAAYRAKVTYWISQIDVVEEKTSNQRDNGRCFIDVVRLSQGCLSLLISFSFVVRSSRIPNSAEDTKTLSMTSVKSEAGGQTLWLQ